MKKTPIGYISHQEFKTRKFISFNMTLKRSNGDLKKYIKLQIVNGKNSEKEVKVFLLLSLKPFGGKRNPLPELVSVITGTKFMFA